MQFSSMAVEDWPVVNFRRIRLLNDFLTVVFSKVELFRIATEGAKFSRNVSVTPTMEDVACIGPERDDVPERLESWECFEDDDVMTLEVTFDCRGESAEASADDDDLDAGFGLGFSIGNVVSSHFKCFAVCLSVGCKVNLCKLPRMWSHSVTAGRQILGPQTRNIRH